MTFEEKDEPHPRPLFITHQMWCDWWIYDEYDACDCGYSDEDEY